MSAIALTSLPDFTRGGAFREMSPQEGKYRYRYVTTRLVRLPVRRLVGAGGIILCKDAKGREWLRIDQFGLLIAEGYAWNGCSPKRWVPLFGWIGTWDFKCTLLASLVHDALYQFHGCRHFPDVLTREACDGIFKSIIELAGDEEIAALYHLALRQFGRWGHGTAQGEYSEILNPAALN